MSPWDVLGWMLVAVASLPFLVVGGSVALLAAVKVDDALRARRRRRLLAKGDR